MFEILSNLGLPRFGRSNWESTIRGLVANHPKYTDMENWPGRETADVTYNDQSGVLTALLIEKGYLVEHIWRNARPKYFMEVKTTTGDCGDRLYISSNQYQLVCRKTSYSCPKLILPDATLHVPTRPISSKCLHYLQGVQSRSQQFKCKTLCRSRSSQAERRFGV